MSKEFDPFGEKTMIRVYQLPARLTDGFCFGGGRSITFLNVDWFEANLSMHPDVIAGEIRKKKYFDPAHRYLVLGDAEAFTFTIDPAGAA